MWPKSYKDYETDKTLVKYQVEPGRGIVGCEMHDLNGWGNSHHIPKGKFSGKIHSRISLTNRTPERDHNER